MKLTTGWTEPAPGVVLITPGGIGLVRLLGLFFAVPGGYFLYQFLGGVLHPSEMTLAGWLMLPAFAALFLVPGWIILVGRKRTRLDASRREAVEEFDFLVYTRRKVTGIPREAHVLLRYEADSTRDARVYLLHVYLDTAAAAPEGRGPGGLILLALFDAKAKPDALELARRVAGLLGADVQDRCIEDGEVTAAGVVVDRLGPGDAD
jgi:hypothetical protein